MENKCNICGEPADIGLGSKNFCSEHSPLDKHCSICGEIITMDDIQSGFGYNKKNNNFTHSDCVPTANPENPIPDELRIRGEYKEIYEQYTQPDGIRVLTFKYSSDEEPTDKNNFPLVIKHGGITYRRTGFNSDYYTVYYKEDDLNRIVKLNNPSMSEEEIREEIAFLTLYEVSEMTERQKKELLKIISQPNCPEDLLKELIENYDELVVEIPSLSEELQKTFIHENPNFLDKLAMRHDLTLENMKRLLDINNDDIRFNLLQNPNFPKTLVDELYNNGDYRIASSPYLTKKQLTKIFVDSTTELHGNRGYVIQQMLCRNPNLPTKLRIKLIDFGHYLLIAKRDDNSISVVEEIKKNTYDAGVHYKVLKHSKDIPKQLLLEWADDSINNYHKVGIGIAKRKEIDMDIIELLEKMNNIRTDKAIFQNPKTPKEAFDYYYERYKERKEWADYHHLRAMAVSPFIPEKPYLKFCMKEMEEDETISEYLAQNPNLPTKYHLKVIENLNSRGVRKMVKHPKLTHAGMKKLCENDRNLKGLAMRFDLPKDIVDILLNKGDAEYIEEILKRYEINEKQQMKLYKEGKYQFWISYLSIYRNLSPRILGKILKKTTHTDTRILISQRPDTTRNMERYLVKLNRNDVNENLIKKKKLDNWTLRYLLKRQNISPSFREEILKRLGESNG